jgi:hypothetical protein
MGLAASVVAAIDELEAAYPGVAVSHREDDEGGAFVMVDPVPLGPPYVQATTWVGFHIPFNYPFADVYPHFVRGDLARLDGQALGEGTSGGTFEARPAIQLSRRSPRRDAGVDTAVLKLDRVLGWLRCR